MNNKNRIPQQFIVRIAIKNEHGAKTGEREFVTYSGLLAVAHDNGLEKIDTTLTQTPTDENGQTAIVRAVALGRAGSFTGIGDANPGNVGKKVVKHLIRVAETRAKARALRDLCNISMLALEELGDDEDVVVDEQPRPQPRRERGEQRGTGISDNQKRALWRKALALGHEGQAAHSFLTERLGCEPAKASREQASRLLDALSAEERHRQNGAGHAAG